MSKKLDAAIDALVDALAEKPEHELEGWQRGNRLGLRILCELGRRYPASCRRRGRFAASRPERFGGAAALRSSPWREVAPATSEFGRHGGGCPAASER
jgi:hypothetical protein